MANKNKSHIELRNKVEALMNEGKSIEDLALSLTLPVGSRFIRGSAKWYRYCIIAKQNQRKAIEKYPGLYSKAGKIAQQKHPWLGYELGKKYGKIAGKIRANNLKGNRDYFSTMAKRLQELDPDHSRKNMEKAHITMKLAGTFTKHQKEAALKCMEKHPFQLKEMSHRSHSLHPLALLALDSRRRHCPYEFMGCLFDSEGERELCKLFVKYGLMNRPKEGDNIHFRIRNCHIDFFIRNKVFVEFHPQVVYAKDKKETSEEYYNRRRELLDQTGYASYPLLLITKLTNVDLEINKIRSLLSFKLD